MASDIWLRTILIVRKETRCRHIGYSYRLTARVLLYAPSHRQDNTYHGLCYTSRGALAGMRNSSMGPPHEGLIHRPIAPWANALPLSYVPLPLSKHDMYVCGAHKYNKIGKCHFDEKCHNITVTNVLIVDTSHTIDDKCHKGLNLKMSQEKI